jgi:D-glycero-alpha-D-manno-heptose 1-phosphate guanylyltransferase
MEAVILAGGRGSRLGELTKDLPKPMVPVGGRPFLEHLLDYWQKEGVGHFILAVGYKQEMIRARFGERYQDSKITYSAENTFLGTGGGLLIALDCLQTDDPFLILNGDTYFEVKLKTFLEFHREKKAEFTFSLREMRSPDRYEGIQTDAEGRIGRFVPREERRADLPVNGGVYLGERRIFDGIPFEAGKNCSMEKDIAPYWCRAGKKIYGMLSGGRFIDIGTPEDYERSQELLKEGKNSKSKSQK